GRDTASTDRGVLSVETGGTVCRDRGVLSVGTEELSNLNSRIELSNIRTLEECAELASLAPPAASPPSEEKKEVAEKEESKKASETVQEGTFSPGQPLPSLASTNRRANGARRRYSAAELEAVRQQVNRGNNKKFDIAVAIYRAAGAKIIPEVIQAMADDGHFRRDGEQIFLLEGDAAL